MLPSALNPHSPLVEPDQKPCQLETSDNHASNVHGHRSSCNGLHQHSLTDSFLHLWRLKLHTLCRSAVTCLCPCIVAAVGFPFVLSFAFRSWFALCTFALTFALWDLVDLHCSWTTTVICIWSHCTKLCINFVLRPCHAESLVGNALVLDQLKSAGFVHSQLHMLTQLSRQTLHKCCQQDVIVDIRATCPTVLISQSFKTLNLLEDGALPDKRWVSHQSIENAQRPRFGPRWIQAWKLSPNFQSIWIHNLLEHFEGSTHEQTWKDSIETFGSLLGLLTFWCLIVHDWTVQVFLDVCQISFISRLCIVKPLFESKTEIEPHWLVLRWVAASKRRWALHHLTGLREARTLAPALVIGLLQGLSCLRSRSCRQGYSFQNLSRFCCRHCSVTPVKQFRLSSCKHKPARNWNTWSPQSKVQSSPTQNRLNPVKSCPNQGSFVHRHWLLQTGKGSMALPTVQCCRFSSHQVVRVLPPFWALTRDFRIWILGLRYHANFSGTESASEYNLKCTTRFVQCHLHSYTTDVYMYMNPNAEVSFTWK